MPGVIDGFPDGWINNEVEDSSTRTCVTASGYDSFWSSCLAGYAELPRGPVKIGPTLEPVINFEERYVLPDCSKPA
jgi:hypothetical protein